MPQVIGALQQRRGELLGVSEAARTFCQTCHHVDGGAGCRSRCGTAARPCRRRKADVRAQELDELRRDGDPPDGPAGPRDGPALVRPFSPRCSWTWPSSVYARPAAGLESAKVRYPQPVSGRWQPSLVSAATSDGRIIA